MPLSIKHFAYFAIVLQSFPQYKELSPNTLPQHFAPPKSSRHAATKRKHPAAALHTQKFASVVRTSLHRAEVGQDSLNQLQMPFDPE